MISKTFLLKSITFCLLLCLLAACSKKETTAGCQGCDCQTLTNTYQTLPGAADSLSAIAAVRGNWQLKCYKYASKYGDISYIDWANQDKLNVQFTDSDYTFYRNDTLLFTHYYFADNGGALRSNGQSFYFGNLGASMATRKDSLLGINTVYPFAGSYYLLFMAQ
jgi:hypothetical protein